MNRTLSAATRRPAAAIPTWRAVLPSTYRPGVSCVRFPDGPTDASRTACPGLRVRAALSRRMITKPRWAPRAVKRDPAPKLGPRTPLRDGPLQARATPRSHPSARVGAPSDPTSISHTRPPLRIASAQTPRTPHPRSAQAPALKGITSPPTAPLMPRTGTPGGLIPLKEPPQQPLTVATRPRVLTRIRPTKIGLMRRARRHPKRLHTLSAVLRVTLSRPLRLTPTARTDRPA